MPLAPSDNVKKPQRFSFAELESLRLLCRQIQQDQEASLKSFEYKNTGGYQHFVGKNKVSVSSTGTCALFLTTIGKWKVKPRQTKELLQDLISRDTSGGLPEYNAYSIAWILESVSALEKKWSAPLDRSERAKIGKMESILQNSLKTGGVQIKAYPPSAYLTQLVIRVLFRRGKLTRRLKQVVRDWAWSELPQQLGMVQAKSKAADAFEVAYLLMLHTALTPKSEKTPEQTSTHRTALKTFFECQLNDGTWPLSRPLFHYRNYGIAYCYEYEMLTQLLHQRELRDFLLDYLPNLRSVIESASRNVYRLDNGIQAWSSGHFLQGKPAESWATASVYHFVHELDRLLAEAFRRELFQYLDLAPPPQAFRIQKTFAPAFLDSTVNVKGDIQSLKKFLWREFVKPLADGAKNVEKGDKFKKGTPISAIFFGPPGTSKTDLSERISDFLSWPLLTIDPSHLLRNGMDEIQAEANHIFRRLEETERVVVLLDEFDEFVRERGSSDAEQFSRLLTTAMLPKLASIHKRATLVFIIATNNIQQFDLAIRRPGRFDRVVQIMPPIFEEKMKKKKNWGVKEDVNVARILRAFGGENRRASQGTDRRPHLSGIRRVCNRPRNGTECAGGDPGFGLSLGALHSPDHRQGRQNLETALCRGGAIQSLAATPIPERLLSIRDSALARVVDSQPARWPSQPTEDAVWGLVRIVMAQQISTQVACRLAERVKAAYPQITSASPYAVPDVNSLRSFGLSERRAQCCVTILQRSDEIRGKVRQGQTWEEALTDIKGIGPWTISVFRIMALRHPDVLPLGDVGLERAIANVYGRCRNVERLGEKWRPFRSVACWYLWRTLGNEQLG